MSKLVKGAIALSFFIASIFSAQAQTYCDTLKWKAIKTYYGNVSGGNFNVLGELDGAVIDTLPNLFFRMDFVNISNDTFYGNETITDLMHCIIHTDTGSRRLSDRGTLMLGKDCLPNDTIKLGVQFFSQKFLDVLLSGIDFEDITHWEFIVGIVGTSKDGTYSDSVFYAGADTSIFYVVKSNVGIKEIENNVGVISVFPNPVNYELTITNYETDNYSIFSVVGQIVRKANCKTI